MAAARGYVPASHQVHASRTVLAKKAFGSSRIGETFARVREKTSPAIIESTDETMIIAGRLLTLKCDRNIASRAALPATCCIRIATAARVTVNATVELLFRDVIQPSRFVR